MASEGTGQYRLAEAVAAICLASDLGIAEPFERGLRMCLVATALANQVGGWR
jgi:hypothetical protein